MILYFISLQLQVKSLFPAFTTVILLLLILGCLHVLTREVKVCKMLPGLILGLLTISIILQFLSSQFDVVTMLSNVFMMAWITRYIIVIERNSNAIIKKTKENGEMKATMNGISILHRGLIYDLFLG